MLNKNATKKEMTPEEMYKDKSKKVGAMFERKLNSIELSNILNASVALVTTFPDTWEKKLDDIQKCAGCIADLKEDNFNHPVEMIRKLREGGIITIENRKHREDYSDSPF